MANKKGSDGRYRYRVCIGKDETGKPKYKSFYGSTAKAARAAAEAYRTALGKGMDPAQSKATLATLYDNLISAKTAKGIGQKSLDRYEDNKTIGVRFWISLQQTFALPTFSGSLTLWPSGTMANHHCPTSRCPICVAAPRLPMNSLSQKWYNTIPLLKPPALPVLILSTVNLSQRNSSSGSVKHLTAPSVLPCCCFTQASAAAKLPPSPGPMSI